MGNAEPVVAGGLLNVARMEAILNRAAKLRNLYWFDKGARCTCSPEAPRESCRRHGETPAIATVLQGPDDFNPGEPARYVLHIGCDCEGCYTLATVEEGENEAGYPVAEAIAHAGRDLHDLVEEVERLRAGVQADVEAALVESLGDAGRELLEASAGAPTAERARAVCVAWASGQPAAARLADEVLVLRARLAAHERFASKIRGLRDRYAEWAEEERSDDAAGVLHATACDLEARLAVLATDEVTSG